MYERYKLKVKFCATIFISFWDITVVVVIELLENKKAFYKSPSPYLVIYEIKN